MQKLRIYANPGDCSRERKTGLGAGTTNTWEFSGGEKGRGGGSTQAKLPNMDPLWRRTQ